MVIPLQTHPIFYLLDSEVYQTLSIVHLLTQVQLFQIVYQDFFFFDPTFHVMNQILAIVHQSNLVLQYQIVNESNHIFHLVYDILHQVHSTVILLNQDE